MYAIINKNDAEQVFYMQIFPIATIENEYKDKLAIPRQSGLVNEVISKIKFEKEYNCEEAVRGIENFSHLWLIWEFSHNNENKHTLTVRPPRLGGNQKVGVFSSRSPYRPNRLGLSCVRLIEVQYDEKMHPTLLVSGADLLSGTPIYDIKPYINYSDCIPDAKSSFASENEKNNASVHIDSELLKKIKTQAQQEVIIKLLEQKPYPAYQNDKERIYGLKYADYEIKFTAYNDSITVVSIENE